MPILLSPNLAWISPPPPPQLTADTSYHVLLHGRTEIADQLRSGFEELVPNSQIMKHVKRVRAQELGMLNDPQMANANANANANTHSDSNAKANANANANGGSGRRRAPIVLQAMPEDASSLAFANTNSLSTSESDAAIGTFLDDSSANANATANATTDADSDSEDTAETQMVDDDVAPFYVEDADGEDEDRSAKHRSVVVETDVRAAFKQSFVNGPRVQDAQGYGHYYSSDGTYTSCIHACMQVLACMSVFVWSECVQVVGY